MADDLKRLEADERLYDKDFYVWTQDQAQRLRALAATGPSASAGLDFEHVAEEIEDLGKSDKRKAISHAQRIVEHLFKLTWTQREEPKLHWRTEIKAWRQRLESVLADSPSLRRVVDDNLDRIHLRAVDLTADQFESEEPAAAIDPDLRWSLPQILGEADDPLRD